MSSLLLSTYLLPWIEKHYARFFSFFNDNIEDSVIVNGQNNTYNTRLHLVEALRSLALAKLNGEEISKSEFDEQIDMFFHLLDDEQFGSQRALRWNDREQLRRRFLQVWNPVKMWEDPKITVLPR